MPRPWLNDSSTPPLDPPPGASGSAPPSDLPPDGVTSYVCDAGHVVPADTLPRDDAVIHCPYPIARQMQCGRRARRQ